MFNTWRTTIGLYQGINLLVFALLIINPTLVGFPHGALLHKVLATGGYPAITLNGARRWLYISSLNTSDVEGQTYHNLVVYTLNALHTVIG